MLIYTLITLDHATGKIANDADRTEYNRRADTCSKARAIYTHKRLNSNSRRRPIGILIIDNGDNPVTALKFDDLGAYGDSGHLIPILDAILKADERGQPVPEFIEYRTADHCRNLQQTQRQLKEAAAND